MGHTHTHPPAKYSSRGSGVLSIGSEWLYSFNAKSERGPFLNASVCGSAKGSRTHFLLEVTIVLLLCGPQAKNGYAVLNG